MLLARARIIACRQHGEARKCVRHEMAIAAARDQLWAGSRQPSLHSLGPNELRYMHALQPQVGPIASV